MQSAAVSILASPTPHRYSRFEDLEENNPRRASRGNGQNDIIRKPIMHQHMGPIHPDAVPVTHDRIFRPKVVAHMYTLRGKAFLRRFYHTQHAAYNRGMSTLRGWFKSGFLGKSCKEFAHKNLRNNRDDANEILGFIQDNIGELEPLYFNDRLTIYWEANDAYLKVLEWRHYQRRHTCSVNVGRSLPPQPLLDTTLQNLVHIGELEDNNCMHGEGYHSPSSANTNILQDLRRHRCYPTFDACTICGEIGLEWHVELFGSTHELPLQVVSWRYNMQLGKCLEYIETPILDKGVICFGIGVLVKSFYNCHYETWEVKITCLNTNFNGFAQTFIPGENGKAVKDLCIGTTICIPSVYARRKSCKVKGNIVDGAVIRDDRDLSRGLSSSIGLDLGMGSKSFSQFMHDAINAKNVYMCNASRGSQEKTSLNVAKTQHVLSTSKRNPNSASNTSFCNTMMPSSGQAIYDNYGGSGTQFKSTNCNPSYISQQKDSHIPRTFMYKEVEDIENEFDQPIIKNPTMLPLEVSQIPNAHVHGDDKDCMEDVEHPLNTPMHPMKARHIPTTIAIASQKGNFLVEEVEPMDTNFESPSLSEVVIYETCSGSKEQMDPRECDLSHAHEVLSPSESPKSNYLEKEVEHMHFKIGSQFLSEVAIHETCDVSKQQEDPGECNRDHVTTPNSKSKSESNKFASINDMMVKFGKDKLPNHKKMQSLTKKRKALQELQSENVCKSNEAAPQANRVSRSLRKIKKPSRFDDQVNDKENNMGGIKKSTKKRGTSKAANLMQQAKVIIPVDMEDHEMESIAIEAMGVHDVDEMYGRLLDVIRPLKSENLMFFADCSSKSEQSHLLRCYVTWIIKGKVANGS